MKAYLKIVVGAVFIGGVMAFFFYKDIKSEVIAMTKERDVVYLFQTGVFKNYDNAVAFSEKFKQKGIYQDDEFYRVFLSITVNNKEKLIDFYEQRDIEFYVKEVVVDETLKKKIENYDLVLEKTVKEDVFYSINQAMIELFLKNVA